VGPGKKKSKAGVEKWAEQSHGRGGEDVRTAVEAEGEIQTRLVFSGHMRMVGETVIRTGTPNWNPPCGQEKRKC